MEPSEIDVTQVTVQGTFWNYAAHFSGKVVVFLSTVVLARLLSQDDFGVAAYAVVVISFLDVLTDLGIGSAVIYFRKRPGIVDTAFWLGLGIGIALFALTFLGAPLVGFFFNDSRAIPVTRVLALTFPISAVSNVHSALLHKELAFNRRFVPEFVKAIGKGIVSIGLAVFGYGAWSLIVGQLVGTAAGTVAYWRAVPWRPSFRFVGDLARSLLSYGVSMTSANVINAALLSADYMFVGRFLGAAALGVYTLAFRVPELAIFQFCYVIGAVAFPLFSKLRDDLHTLTQGFLATTRYVSIVTVPLGLGLAVVAEPFVLTVFTEKWVEAIVVIRAIALYSALASLSYAAGEVFKAQGRPSVLTKLSVVRVAILIPGLWWATTVSGTLEAVGWMHVLYAFLHGTLDMTVVAHFLNLSVGSILETFRPAAVGGALMVLATWTTLTVSAATSPLVQLIASVTAGALVYGAAMWWLQRDLILAAGASLRGMLART